MATTTQTRSVGTFIAALAPFLIVLIVGLVLVGPSAPFWQILVVAVLAGLVGLASGQLVARRLRH